MPLPSDTSAGSSSVDVASAMLEALHAQLAPARARLAEREAVRTLIDPDADPTLMLAFMVQFGALCVQLQEPVEQFLVAASQRCEELGDRRLARSLLRLAHDAIDHYGLIADDARVLALRWNEGQQPELELTWLLTQPITPAMQRILTFHAQQVASDEPWAELALICELEAWIIAIAPFFVLLAERRLGADIRAGLRSVVNLAVAGDRGRARTTLGELLAEHPERLPVIVHTSERLLALYAEFLDDCMVAAVNLAHWRQLAHG